LDRLDCRPLDDFPLPFEIVLKYHGEDRSGVRPNLVHFAAIGYRSFFRALFIAQDLYGSSIVTAHGRHGVKGFEPHQIPNATGQTPEQIVCHQDK
jgi:hypothetical protein